MTNSLRSHVKLPDPVVAESAFTHQLVTFENEKTINSQPSREYESQYPGKLKLGVIVLSLNLAMFLVGLDNTIISSAIPKITDQFNALKDVVWYASLVGAMYGFAAIVGPLLGGVYTESSRLIWRWCFYINIPLGLPPALIISFFISPFEGSKQGKLGLVQQIKQVDLPGTVCLLAAIVCLLLALQWGGTQYPWKSGPIIALLVLAGISFIGFGVIQHHSGDLATVPGRVLGNRNVWGSSLFGSCVTGGFFIMMYYIPIWLQAIKGASPIRSGVMNLPVVLSYVTFSLLGGALTSVIGYYMPFAYLTVIFMATGSGLLSSLTADSSSAQWIGYQFLFGAGVGSGLQTAFAAPQCVLPLEDISIGSAIVMFTEKLVAAVIVSVAQNVFTNQLQVNLATYVPDADVAAILAGGATGIRSVVPDSLYQAVIYAYNKSLDQTFYVGVTLSCLGVLGVLAMEWISVKEKN